MTQATPSRHTMRYSRTLRHALLAMSLGFVSFALPSAAVADDVQANGMWVPNVTIQTVSKGELQYQTNLGSDMSIPLTQVQGIKIPAFPDLWAAQEAILAKNHAAAVPLLQKVEGQARQAWLKHYAAWLRIHALDRAGRSVEAVEAYLSLARAKPAADTFYLQRPPLSSLPNASATQKQDLHKRLTQAKSEFDGVPLAAIDAMIAQLGTIETPAAGQSPAPATNSAAPKPSAPAPAAVVPVPTPGQPAAGGIVDASQKITNTTGVAMSTYMAAPDRDEVSALLYQGKWDEAAAKCKELLAGRETRLSMRLYQQGLALLQIAEKSGDENTYKDAGLSFSRSIFYFPTSAVAGPGLVELAYIHTKINRPDLALKLLDKARLQVDETQDPEIHARMEKIIASLSAPAGSVPAGDNQ